MDQQQIAQLPVVNFNTQISLYLLVLLVILGALYVPEIAQVNVQLAVHQHFQFKAKLYVQMIVDQETMVTLHPINVRHVQSHAKLVHITLLPQIAKLVLHAHQVSFMMGLNVFLAQFNFVINVILIKMFVKTLVQNFSNMILQTRFVNVYQDIIYIMELVQLHAQQDFIREIQIIFVLLVPQIVLLAQV